MIVFLNGRFVSEERALVSVSDRGFLYGDGLFETVRVHRSRPFLLARNLERLRRSAEFLGIQLPYSAGEFECIANELIRRNGAKESLLRLSVSRGVGPRGYSPKEATHPTVFLSLHSPPKLNVSTPARWKLATASLRINASDPFTHYKTSNKLLQILARAEAEARGADEGLLLNTEGFVAETASANIFWIRRGTVFTPPLDCGALPGITRGLVMSFCREKNIACREMRATPDKLRRADGVFLSLSSFGLVEVASLDGARLRRSPLVARLWKTYLAALERDDLVGDG
ncbi:MAG: aminotransferase class IV [Verrucomicrobia bacterium]|nr:aminotransferase class IV [Verrucomicrobiota bacterium]